MCTVRKRIDDLAQPESESLVGGGSINAEGSSSFSIPGEEAKRMPQSGHLQGTLHKWGGCKELASGRGRTSCGWVGP
jgi:hypothetical protein